MKRKSIAISFWGVRGSIASPHLKNSRYGGHTACVSLHFKKRWFICDAGTGIRPLGALLQKKRGPIAIFLSHLHWDHLFGLPFFKPLYQRKRKILLMGPATGNRSFKRLIGEIIKPPFFPLRPDFWEADVRWQTLKMGLTKVDPVFVESRRVDHHEKTLGFKFLFPGGRKIVYVTDQELLPANKSFARWIENADLLIHDSQYDRKTYRRKKGWGHSSFEIVLEMAVKAKVKRLVLFHHDPDAEDRLLEKRLAFCKKQITARKSSLKCFLAQEGSTILI